MTNPDDERRERARKHVEEMPAETALGNPDPAGGSTDDPKVIDEAAREKNQQ
jgi:hypothetical protein